MNYPTPELQESGSMNCTYYAAAYISRLFGFKTKWYEVKEWCNQNNRVAEVYPKQALGIKTIWSMYDGEARSRLIAYSKQPGFRKWIEAYIEHGCIAFAVTHLVPSYGHAVVLIGCDDEGVILADSVRGIVKDSWEFFLRPNGNGSPSRIETWYKVET